jgi:hypothetical protein
MKNEGVGKLFVVSEGMVSGRKLVRIGTGLGRVVIRSGHFGPYSGRGWAMNGPDYKIIFGKFMRQVDFWL